MQSAVEAIACVAMVRFADGGVCGDRILLPFAVEILSTSLFADRMKYVLTACMNESCQTELVMHIFKTALSFEMMIR